MQLHQLSHQVEEHSRELRLEADRRRLVRAATPSFRKRLARFLHLWASRLEQVRDARPEPQYFGAEQFGQSGRTMSFDRANNALTDQ